VGFCQKGVERFGFWFVTYIDDSPHVRGGVGRKRRSLIKWETKTKHDAGYRRRAVG